MFNELAKIIMDDFLIITLDLTSRSHDDLKLTIPSAGISIVADSYYFGLDDSIEVLDDKNKVESLVLVAILKQWKIKIANLKSGDICFLPFDFSDEYIGCFSFEAERDSILGIYGYTGALHGYSIYPSKVAQFKIEDTDFKADSPPFNVERAVLLYSVDNCIEKLQSEFDL